MPQAVQQTRRSGRRPDPNISGEVAALIAANSAAPKLPKVSVLASSSSTCMVNSPIRFMALSSSACTGSPLRCFERGVDPADRFRHATARAGRYSTPNWRDRSCTGSSGAKAAERPHACAPPVHRWPSPSGPAGKAWPGENVDEPSSPAFTTGRIRQQTFEGKIIGHVPVLLGHLPIKRNSVSQGNRVRLRRTLRESRSSAIQ